MTTDGDKEPVATHSLGENLRFPRFAFRRAARRAVAAISAPLAFLVRSPFSTRIDRIVIAPQDLRTTDPTAAGDIYSGYFSFAGKVVSTIGASPFEAAAPSRAWTEALMGFGWLRDIRAADTALARANARTLVDDWINKCGRPSQTIAWDAPIIARRLIAWLSHSPIILEGADRAFYRRFLGSIGRQSSRLWHDLHHFGTAEARLHGAIALTFVAICTDGSPRQLKRVSALLIRALNREILSDGGHISRNPQVLVDLLVDLLPLRHAFLSQNQVPPQDLLNAIDRMMPMVRMFRHGDGALALFNGMSATAPDLVATLLAYQDARVGAVENATHSGYRRIQGDQTLLIMDTGTPPPEDFSSRSHAGCLSFELSDGVDRIIVNCGAPGPGQDQKRSIARSTAAHSTAVLSNQSSCRFAPADEARWPYGGPVISGPEQVTVTRTDDDDSESIDAGHDGYASAFGISHHRRLTMDKNGSWLIGEDSFNATNKRALRAPDDFTIRFHLHPLVEAQALSDGQSVRLVLPSGRAWTFSTDGQPIMIEDSIFFASLDGMRRTTQIVIEGHFRDSPGVKWSLIRDGAT